MSKASSGISRRFKRFLECVEVEALIKVECVEVETLVKVECVEVETLVKVECVEVETLKLNVSRLKH